MAKVTVYHFKGFDVKTSEFHTPHKMATLDFITKHKYEAIMEMAIEVDESKLDGNGFYFPPSQGEK